MSKITLYSTAKVLPGNKIEIQVPSLSTGQAVEVIILVPETTDPSSPIEEQPLSLEQRLAFLKLPLAERRRILETQTETMLEHYQHNCEWQELMAGDIIND